VAKVTINFGDEVEVVVGDSQFTLGRLKALNVIDLQRSPGHIMLTLEGVRIEIPGPVDVCAVRMDFDVMPGQFDAQRPAGQSG
jgi:hypothetical protein